MSLFGKKPPTDDPELIEALREFIGSVEVVFHHDWSCAKMMIGDEAEGGTFLKPELDDESEDWGSRGKLPENYRKLKSLMEQKKLTSKINPQIN